MRSTHLPLFVILFCLAVRQTLGTFFLHSVGPFHPSAGRRLRNKESICPNETMYSSGFNVKCSFSPEARYANFYVNGVWVRKERVVPFFIAGDWAGKVWKWDDYPAEANVTCRADDGREDNIQLWFTCPDDIDAASVTGTLSPTPSSAKPSGTPIPSPGISQAVVTPSHTSVAAQDSAPTTSSPSTAQTSSTTSSPALPSASPTPVPPSSTVPTPSSSPISAPPASLFLRPIAHGTAPSLRITDGMSICPSTVFDGKPITVLCRPSPESKWARFFVNGDMVWLERRMPYYIAGDRNGVAFPWRDIPNGETNIRCVLSDGAESSVDVQVGC